MTRKYEWPEPIYSKRGYRIPITKENNEVEYAFVEISIPEPTEAFSQMMIENTTTHYAETCPVTCKIDDEFLENWAWDFAKRTC